MKYVIYMIYIIGIVIIIALTGYSIFYQPAIMRKEVEDLYLKGDFSMGTVSAVVAAVYRTPQVQASIHYKFEVSDRSVCAVLAGARIKQISKITNDLFLNRPSYINKNDRFLVLYDKNNPNNAILLLDHPISSEADFERYKAEIEELRKDTTWRGYK
jgi:hypothetical protein